MVKNVVDSQRLECNHNDNVHRLIFRHKFNSYYEVVGARHPRPQRGMLTRPTIDQVLAYRAHVDTAVLGYLRSMDEGTWARLGPLLNLGLHHEEQHQELILTDILHLFSYNPVRPAFKRGVPTERWTASPFSWHDVSDGIYEIGHDGAGFAFDHEGTAPRGADQALSQRLTTGDQRRMWLSLSHAQRIGAELLSLAQGIWRPSY